MLISRFSTKKREREYKDIIEKLKGEIEMYIEQTESFTLVSGINNRNFQFNRCDLYITEQAIIVLGFTKDSFIKDLSAPIILTSQIASFSRRFPYAYVKKINTIDFRNNCIQINFGEKGFAETEVDLDLNSLSDIEKNKIKQLTEQNNWG
jgi:hypothetical protein